MEHTCVFHLTLQKKKEAGINVRHSIVKLQNVLMVTHIRGWGCLCRIFDSCSCGSFCDSLGTDFGRHRFRKRGRPVQLPP